MRRLRGLLPGLLLGLLAGCATDQSVRPASWLDRVRSGQAPLASDGVLLDISLIEKPILDAEINDVVWNSTDEQVVALEHKWKLEESGFRVGHVIGMTPERLQALLTNDRHCVWRKRQILPANKSLALDISRVAQEFRFQIRQDGQAVPVELEQAQAYLI
ncbi:MAG TPA: hypothetical protein VEL76_21635, partial [Gemmataceae bacterium]|nr:hypothetical protein [Gemmataceae bacterium]